jgi:hypothetical protein
MKLGRGFAAIWALTLVAGCTLAAEQQDEMLVKAGFTKTPANLPEGASALSALLYLRFDHRTVDGVPMVFYADPVVCKCIYAGSEAAFAAYKQAYTEQEARYDNVRPP